MVEPFADTAGRPDPDPLLAMWLPAAPTSSTNSPVRTQRDADAERADTNAGHRTSTPGPWTADAWTSPTRTLDGHTRHQTPDAWSDRVRGQGDQTRKASRTDLLDDHDFPTACWDARTVDLWSAPSALGDGEVPASARLPTAPPGTCSVAPSARPSRALAHCCPQMISGRA
jgi:hypothetical protein